MTGRGKSERLRQSLNLLHSLFFYLRLRLLALNNKALGWGFTNRKREKKRIKKKHGERKKREKQGEK